MRRGGGGAGGTLPPPPAAGNTAAVGGEYFRFFLSCDINVPVRVRIERLTVASRKRAEPGFEKPWNYKKDDDKSAAADSLEQAELCVACQLFVNGTPAGPEMLTAHVTASADGSFTWGEWLTLPYKIRDLPANAQLALTVWNVAHPRCAKAAGGTIQRLFSKANQLKAGRRKLRVWLGCAADGSLDTSTPGKVPKKERGEIHRLEKLLKRYERGELPHIDWLDQLAFAKIECIRKRELAANTSADRGELVVELPRFEHPVIFQELAVPVIARLTDENDLVRVVDPEIYRDNPSETKQLKLARSGGGVVDRDLKPNSAERKRIAGVLQLPPTKALSGEEKQLLWKFRYSLTQDARALTKFVKCVDWGDAHEARQASELLRSWMPIGAADALELLSPEVTSPIARAHAVAVLERTDDEELQGYLLQLVHALRHETADDSRLSRFLVGRASRSPDLANFLHWYLTVEFEDKAHGPRFGHVHTALVDALVREEGGDAVWIGIQRQGELVSNLAATVRDLKALRSQKKTERLRAMLSREGAFADLHQGVPLPISPRVTIGGISAADSFVFKSVMSPLLLAFRSQHQGASSGMDASTGGVHKVIFKKGDDLRQDQLVIQLLSLMDRLLKRENLDLKMTPYRVLATGPDEGMVEFVPSMTLARILAEYKSITRFFAAHSHGVEDPLGTFVRSCAGYCVITYVLGVGDRHLDNLMVTTDGRLFHIDFAYILGADPKPFPPPMKLCKEMVEAMGGADSAYYAKFKSLCCEAFNILRKSANLILNLVRLTAGSTTAARDPETSALKLLEKFRLDLDDEAAVQYMQSLINDSVSALFPQMVETIHRWAQYWR
eukprot:jgi/Chlat1/5469/Chrsp36S05427